MNHELSNRLLKQLEQDLEQNPFQIKNPLKKLVSKLNAVRQAFKACPSYLRRVVCFLLGGSIHLCNCGADQVFQVFKAKKNFHIKPEIVVTDPKQIKASLLLQFGGCNRGRIHPGTKLSLEGSIMTRTEISNLLLIRIFVINPRKIV
jgi:hypothetical protein